MLDLMLNIFCQIGEILEAITEVTRVSKFLKES